MLCFNSKMVYCDYINNTIGGVDLHHLRSLALIFVVLIFITPVPAKAQITDPYQIGDFIFALELGCANGYVEACRDLSGAMDDLYQVQRACWAGRQDYCMFYNQIAFGYQQAVYNFRMVIIPQMMETQGSSQSQATGCPPGIDASTCQLLQMAEAVVEDSQNIQPGSGNTYDCPPQLDAMTCQLIGQANTAMAEAWDYTQREVVPEANRRQQELNNLFVACQNGDTDACDTYSYQMQRQDSRADMLIEMMNHMYGPESGWAESFSYGN